MITRIKALLILTTLHTMTVAALAEPNYTGTWRMNPQESALGFLKESGTLFGPYEVIQTIDHAGSVLKIELVQQGGSGEIRADLTYLTDGSECRNELEGYILTSKLAWDGDVLVVRSSLAMDPFYPELVDRWTLSEDGRKLTITRRLLAMSGEDQQELVFERQE